jgi:SAM-dependent methyltransferase
MPENASPSLRSRLWDAFQSVIGGNAQKMQAVRESMGAPRRVLEIGCATGNVAAVFAAGEYVGVDVDATCIALARAKFPRPNYRFHCLDILEDALPEPGDFDRVLISHTAHHLPDDYMKRLLQRSAELLADDGELMILDMLRPEPRDPFRKQFYYKLDRGAHFRSLPEFVDLFEGDGGFDPPRTRVVRTRKLGIEVIDQIMVVARKRGRAEAADATPTRP